MFDALEKSFRETDQKDIIKQLYEGMFFCIRALGIGLDYSCGLSSVTFVKKANTN